jgi:hypothetical protein
VAVKPCALALLLLLASTRAGAQEPADAPYRDRAPPPPDLPWRHYAVPALEAAAANLSLLAFSNLVTRMDFALISPQTLSNNLKPQSWSFDVDYYLTNQFGHPYQGSVYFNAARSSGLSFWWSALYATLGSLTWELFFESEPPSVNDQITTPMGGALLGEVLHRAALQVRRGGLPGWLGAIGATLLDPMGAINGALLDDPSPEDVTLDPIFMRWQFGAGAGVVINRDANQPADRTPLQAVVAVLLVSGPPWDPRSTYDAPLSYFDLRADISFPSKVVGNLFIRGLLAGNRFSSPTGHLQGVWGLFGDYDYAAPAIIRASAVGVGPGFILQVQPLPRLYLQAGGLLGLSPLATAGQLIDVSPDLGRDYHVGPGSQVILDLRLVRPGWFQLELSARNWIVVGAYTPPDGFETITYVTGAVEIPVWRWFDLGAEVTLSDRRAHFAGIDGTEHDTGFMFRVLLCVSTEPHFGIADPARTQN